MPAPAGSADDVAVEGLVLDWTRNAAGLWNARVAMVGANGALQIEVVAAEALLPAR